MNNRTCTLLLLAFASGCSFPQFSATRTVNKTVPVDSRTLALRCDTHNGSIAVRGVPGATEVRLRVDISVRGNTQDEADANLATMSIAHESKGGELSIAGSYDRSQLSGMSPMFAFTLEVPSGLALYLESHNGDLSAEAMDGGFLFETHNGNIHAQGRGRELKLTTHNGDVDVQLQAEGRINGSCRSHNGNVRFTATGEPDAALTAATHNGRVKLERELQNASQRRTQLEGDLGTGVGHIELSTHNGDIIIR